MRQDRLGTNTKTCRFSALSAGWQWALDRHHRMGGRERDDSILAGEELLGPRLGHGRCVFLFQACPLTQTLRVSRACLGKLRVQESKTAREKHGPVKRFQVELQVCVPCRRLPSLAIACRRVFQGRPVGVWHHGWRAHLSAGAHRSAGEGRAGHGCQP